MKTRRFQYLSLFFLLCGAVGFGGESTGVGHGDTLTQYLENTRYVLIQTLEKLSSEKLDSRCECDEKDRGKDFCRPLLALSREQRALCVRFIREAAKPILALNAKGKRTELLLQSRLIESSNPEGKAFAVNAETDFGAKGAITFHYDSIRTMRPTVLLALMTHEFGHKIPFLGKEFLVDNAPVEAFSGASGGRALLDAVGAAVVVEALRFQFIGETFDLGDLFSCQIQEAGAGPVFKSSGVSPRGFRNGQFDHYETGIGNTPQDFYCEIEEGPENCISLNCCFAGAVGSFAAAPARRGSKKLTEAEGKSDSLVRLNGLREIKAKDCLGKFD